MIVRRMMAATVAASMAVAPAVAYAAPTVAPAQAANVRASAGTDGASQLAGEGTPVLLGLILVVLLAMIAVSGGDGPDNTPVSP